MMKKQDEQRLVPKLRFKGFSEDWEQRKLKDMYEIIMGQSPLSKNYTEDTRYDILVQGNADLKDGKVIPRIYTKQVTKLAKPNSIIFTVRAPVGQIAINTKKVVIGRGVCSIEGDKFLYHKLEQLNNIKYWNKFSTGSTFDSINSNDLKNMVLHIPKNIEEKNRISHILDILDSMITLHKRKIQVLKDQKNLYLNKMFISQQGDVQLRFKGFTEPWEQLKMGEVFKYEQPTKYLVTSADYSDEYQTPVLTAGQSFILGYTDETEGIKNASKTDPVIIFDDFTTGNHYVDFPFKIKSSALKILSISDRSYDEYFTFYSLNRIKYSPQNHQRHWISMFSRIKINIPTIAEQASIGNLLRTIDNMISLHNKKLNKLESLKKEYLNYLFI